MLLSIPPGIEFGTIRKTEGHHSGRGAGNLFSQPLSRRRPGEHVSKLQGLGVAGLFSFMVYAENPNLGVEFRVMQLGNEITGVSYGFKGTAVEDIKRMALEYRNAIALKEMLRKLR